MVPMKKWIAGIAIGMAAAVAVALTQEDENVLATTTEKPPIDLEVPGKLETATFALG